MNLRIGAALLCAALLPGQVRVAPGTGSLLPYDDRQATLIRVSERPIWYARLADIAEVDEVDYASLPPARIPVPAPEGAANPLIIHAWTFVPKVIDRGRKQPLIVLPHGGVHGNFTLTYLHIVRELVEQGYSVIAPDYRGSTGYGMRFYEQIDYGGRETDDVLAARNWMLDAYPFLDEKRVGLVGWSHGGMISLMNVFGHPDAYAVVYAGVPVSDLVARLAYKPPTYAREFSVAYHIGKTVAENPQEYQRRSPVTHAAELRTPLLIHTNTIDEDVSVEEVKRLIRALTAAGKKFESKIYEAAPGGHMFNRIDTRLARESRREIWRFLAPYLQPERPAQ